MKKKDPMNWKIPVESTRYLEVKQHPEREGEFSQIRRSSWSWMWRSAFIKDVTVLKSWSYLLIRDKTVSWVRIMNGINKYVETISLEKHWTKSYREFCCEGNVTTEVCCHTVSYFFSSSCKKNGWTSNQRNSVKIISQCQKSWSDYYDMIHQFFVKIMEQYDLTILWKSSKQSSMVLCSDQETIG